MQTICLDERIGQKANPPLKRVESNHWTAVGLVIERHRCAHRSNVTRSSLLTEILLGRLDGSFETYAIWIFRKLASYFSTASRISGERQNETLEGDGAIALKDAAVGSRILAVILRPCKPVA